MPARVQRIHDRISQEKKNQSFIASEFGSPLNKKSFPIEAPEAHRAMKRSKLPS